MIFRQSNSTTSHVRQEDLDEGRLPRRSEGPPEHGTVVGPGLFLNNSCEECCYGVWTWERGRADPWHSHIEQDSFTRTSESQAIAFLVDLKRGAVLERVVARPWVMLFVCGTSLALAETKGTHDAAPG
eukprot:6480400-Amphidinium_carterae.1